MCVILQKQFVFISFFNFKIKSIHQCQFKWAQYPVLWKYYELIQFLWTIARWTPDPYSNMGKYIQGEWHTEQSSSLKEVWKFKFNFKYVKLIYFLFIVAKFYTWERDNE